MLQRSRRRGSEESVTAAAEHFKSVQPTRKFVLIEATEVVWKVLHSDDHWNVVCGCSDRLWSSVNWLPNLYQFLIRCHCSCRVCLRVPALLFVLTRVFLSFLRFTLLSYSPNIYWKKCVFPLLMRLITRLKLRQLCFLVLPWLQVVWPVVYQAWSDSSPTMYEHHLGRPITTEHWLCWWFESSKTSLFVTLLWPKHHLLIKPDVSTKGHTHAFVCCLAAAGRGRWIVGEVYWKAMQEWQACRQEGGSLMGGAGGEGCGGDTMAGEATREWVRGSCRPVVDNGRNRLAGTGGCCKTKSGVACSREQHKSALYRSENDLAKTVGGGKAGLIYCSWLISGVGAGSSTHGRTQSGRTGAQAMLTPRLLLAFRLRWEGRDVSLWEWCQMSCVNTGRMSAQRWCIISYGWGLHDLFHWWRPHPSYLIWGRTLWREKPRATLYRKTVLSISLSLTHTHI